MGTSSTTTSAWALRCVQLPLQAVVPDGMSTIGMLHNPDAVLVSLNTSQWQLAINNHDMLLQIVQVELKADPASMLAANCSQYSLMQDGTRDCIK